jgi:tetratricopeptide (TPR) repeat protein
VVTLQNEAAAYQKLWELEKSADYMEAILYNMNSYLENSLPIEMTHEIRNQSSEPYKSFTTFIVKRMDAVAYNLQYSAVSSQIGKHDTALFSAKKALEVLSVVLTELYSYECFVKNKINKNSQLKLLRDLCRGSKNEKIVPLIKYIQNKFICLK